jgi:hypothetical protein
VYQIRTFSKFQTELVLTKNGSLNGTFLRLQHFNPKGLLEFYVICQIEYENVTDIADKRQPHARAYTGGGEMSAKTIGV